MIKKLILKRIHITNKKGFTLVELLGVIILLGVIATIIAPNILKTQKKSEKELFEEFNEKPIERNKVEKQENKLPEIDIDQYMKNFNENDVDDVDNIFNDDNIFPSIPL